MRVSVLPILNVIGTRASPTMAALSNRRGDKRGQPLLTKSRRCRLKYLDRNPHAIATVVKLRCEAPVDSEVRARHHPGFRAS